ncbi:4-oxalomesaconate tautomerase [Celeribacter baekdonensis]|uniref:Methylitaconate delta2-delta3-isomerase n=1 Tax=Celeribacter baekdonensis B30 TaxID=1208323 RepID=K2J5K1_9RHOB|nr:4-oxalomesaconate tautomerase [Celeribacter baekdonensis]EKE70338.1 methylitaconate delta2-delta3-isomerase [Celeribacter baekdonensis B30]|tara:strand:- start:1814 stop:2908 length:1095 start_codon:yes stop_codon:yes gene_type:complete
MTQTAIPYLLLRGGTSRGPYFNRADLPEDHDTLSGVLVAVLGSGQKLNIDGIGGGAAVTTKVAMLSKSDVPGVDIDYFFAQVSVEDRLVDYKPTCGNILSGVGPAAIEMGLITPTGDETRVRIRSVNTGARVEAVVSTPNGRVSYEGEAKVDGVPGTSAPIYLNFMDVVGSATGALLPTGAVRDVIDGIEVTCMDVAMPIAIARASDFGLTGYESAEELDANRAFYARMEPIRLEAGRRMGMGDVSKSVTPKFALLAAPRHGGTITARYFMPWNCHPTMAVTGAQCLASCVLTPGTVAEGLFAPPSGSPALVRIEHASGEIDVTVDYASDDTGFHLKSAGLLRTARLLARGEVFVPSSIWDGKA